MLFKHRSFVENDLLTLVHSNKFDTELLKQMFAFIPQAFRGKTEHSVFYLDSQQVTTIISTLTDLDEVHFLRNQIQSIFNSQTPLLRLNGRYQITHSQLIPLIYDNSPIGYWVIDFYKEKRTIRAKKYDIIPFVSHLLTMYWLKRKKERSYYLDSLTNLPDKRYVLSFLNMSQEQKWNGSLCMIRYNEQNSMDDQNFLLLSHKLQQLNLGILCRFDTLFALLLMKDLIEAYDHTFCIMDFCQKDSLRIKILLFRFTERDTYLPYLDFYFKQCAEGEQLLLDPALDSPTDSSPCQAENTQMDFNPVPQELEVWIKEDIKRWI